MSNATVHCPPFIQLFFFAYLEAALFSTCQENGQPMDRKYSESDIAPESRANMLSDCLRFFEENGLADFSNEDLKRAGHDFWLTRNGHGAGFWDGDWPEEIGNRLTAASHMFGEDNLIEGDDGKVYNTTRPEPTD